MTCSWDSLETFAVAWYLQLASDGFVQCSFYPYICQAVLVKRLVWVPMEPGMRTNYLRDYRTCKGGIGKKKG